MQASPKPEENAKPSGAAADGAESGKPVAAATEAGAAAHASPARALQARLVRELVRPGRPWMLHSAGLVLVALLSLWAAGLILSAGL